jgi:L-aminoadipate-semialdehyde dehydrogenase
MTRNDILDRLGLSARNSGVYAGEWIDRADADLLPSISPIDGSVIGSVTLATEEDYETTVLAAHEAFLRWRTVPAPLRGAVIRDLGDAIREVSEELGALISLEMGKIRPEGVGEVVEVTDMADFAVGLSRQLYGLTMHSERPHHRMYEQWHPLGILGIVTAFNFPVAVWGWNAMLAAVCGDSMIWKPSSKTPLTAVACSKIAAKVFTDHGHPGVMCLSVGRGSVVGERLINDRRVPLISATGSCRMGRRIGEVVAGRLGKAILELGGNNAVIVTEDADLDLATRAILFGAVGTAGQRCTSTRRVLMDGKIADELTRRLLASYAQVPIGDPLADGILMGPMVDAGEVATFVKALETIKEQGGEVICGGEVLEGDGFGSGCYVQPTLVKAPKNLPMMQEETFAPILYLVTVDGVEEAIAVQNGVDQGLSSAIFTTDLRSAEAFLSAAGSDCGIANVNIGTSGAEIGGAFGGEKDTGGGREAGSDSWKAYMRRQTNTINYGGDLPLAQGIQFG